MADKPIKRVVKNPETFRERAIKAAEEGDKPARRPRLRQAGSRVVSPVSKAGTLIGRFKPVRIIGRIIVPKYVRNSWKELQQVRWPSLNESRRLTFAVLVFAVIFGVTIAVVDYGLDKLFRNILLK